MTYLIRKIDLITLEVETHIFSTKDEAIEKFNELNPGPLTPLIAIFIVEIETNVIVQSGASLSGSNKLQRENLGTRIKQIWKTLPIKG